MHPRQRDYTHNPLYILPYAKQPHVLLDSHLLKVALSDCTFCKYKIVNEC